LLRAVLSIVRSELFFLYIDSHLHLSGVPGSASWVCAIIMVRRVQLPLPKSNTPLDFVACARKQYAAQRGVVCAWKV
jgi:hypothetical protein